MEYKQAHGHISAPKPLNSGASVTFDASLLRPTATGLHARLSILIGNTLLAWDNCNIERDENRTRLANSAHRKLGPIEAKAYPKEHLKHDLDQFCGGLQEELEKALSPVELEGDTESIQTFALEPYLIEGGGTIIYAPPGRGKSYIGQLMAICIDAGMSTLWPVRQQRILHIQLERSGQSVARRLAYLNQALGLPPKRKLLTLNARGRSMQQVYTAASRAVEKWQVGAILVDSLSRAGLGNLNDNEPANAMVDMLNALSPTWLLLAHTPRQNEEHVFGSQMFTAGADVEIQLLTEGKENGTLGLGLQITKANDLPHYPMEVLALEFSPMGLSAIRKANNHEFIQIEARKKLTPRDAIIEALRNREQASAEDLSQDTGIDRSNISRVLANDPSFVLVKKEARGKKIYGLKDYHTPEEFR